MEFFKTVLVTVLSVSLSLSLPIPVKEPCRNRGPRLPCGSEGPSNRVVHFSSSSYPVPLQRLAGFSPSREVQNLETSTAFATSSGQTSHSLNLATRPTPFRFVPIGQLRPSAIADRGSPGSSKINHLSFDTIQRGSLSPAKKERGANLLIRESEAEQELPDQLKLAPSPRKPTSSAPPTKNKKGGPLRGNALYRKRPVMPKEENARPDPSTLPLLDSLQASLDGAQSSPSPLSHHSLNLPPPIIPRRSWPFTLESSNSLPFASPPSDKREN